MKTKELSQFLCDYFPAGSLVEIDAVWLQRTIQEKIQNERLMAAQLAYYRNKIERLSTKIEILKVDRELSEIENNVIYRVDVRA
jgi:hypothetical protein